jgi:8-oxo-dGTP pyrophosphatase MutT (NUDIX family)
MFDRIRRAIRPTNQPTTNDPAPRRLPTLSPSVGFMAHGDLRTAVREMEEECGYVLSLVALVEDGIVAVDQYGSHFILTSQGVN